MYVDWPICGSSLSVIPNPLKRTGLYGLGCGPNCSGRGLGYFSSGLDISGWGAAEWATVAAGVYLALFSGASVTGGRRRRSGGL
jgi:hypothetical protein